MQIIETCWEKPITVRLQSGLEHTFHSLEESLDFLENEWPTRFGMHHQRAVDLCHSAAKRMASVERARKAFIAACIEANMPVVMSVVRSGSEPQPAASR